MDLNVVKDVLRKEYQQKYKTDVISLFDDKKSYDADFTGFFEIALDDALADYDDKLTEVIVNESISKIISEKEKEFVKKSNQTISDLLNINTYNDTVFIKIPQQDVYNEIVLGIIAAFTYSIFCYDDKYVTSRLNKIFEHTDIRFKTVLRDLDLGVLEVISEYFFNVVNGSLLYNGLMEFTTKFLKSDITEKLKLDNNEFIKCLNCHYIALRDGDITNDICELKSLIKEQPTKRKSKKKDNI